MIRDLSAPAGRLEFRTGIALDELGRFFRGAAPLGGRANVNGTVEFEDTRHYRLDGKLAARDVSVRQDGRTVRGLSAGGNLTAVPGRVELSGLQVNGLGGSFTGTARLEDARRLSVEGRASNLEVSELLTAAGAQTQPWNGRVSGPVSIRGDLRRPGLGLEARAKLAIVPGPGALPVTGNLDLDYSAGRGTLVLGASSLALPHTRADVTGSLGREIRIRIVSTDLNDILPVLAMVSPQAPKTLPVALRNGTASFTGTVTGTIAAPVIAGRLVVTNLEVEGRVFDRLQTDVSLSSAQAALSGGQLARGPMQASFDGTLAMVNFRPQPASPLSARASLSGGDLADLMAIAGQRGDFAGTTQAALTAGGTWGDPRASGEVTVRGGRLFGEAFDRIQAKAGYSGRVISVDPLEVESGSARLVLTARYDHAPGDMGSGRFSFRLAGNRVDLATFPPVQARWPGLAGSLELKADGSADLRRRGGQPQVLFSTLNANLAARGLLLNRQPFGNLTLTAETRGGAVAFHLMSDFAKSAIRGDGTWRLSGDYPLQAEVVFKSVWLSAVRQWLSSTPGAALPFDASAEGRLTISGPVLEREKMRASAEITRFEAGPLERNVPGTLQRVVIRNDGPVKVAVEGSTLRIERARLTGPQTEITASGKVSLAEKSPLDVRITGNTQLDVVQDFARDVYAAGAVTLNTTIRGTLAKPSITGRIDLKEASLNIPDIPNGISNATGSVRFDGAQAIIENITAETGGGKLILSGFVAYGTGELVFRILAKAEEVRVRYPEGVSTTSNVELTWTGTSLRSTLTGTVTILRAGFNPSSDLGSILAQTTQPVRTPASRGGLLDGIRFDVQIQSAPNLQFQSALARDIQAGASLRLRGSFTNPALLGRINITQGEVTFFGTRYDIQQGSIAFYNPVRVEPVLNIDLETKARGITVILNVSGPVTRLNLTHRSDPPLPFSEVVALLATGRAPTSDPGLAARETAQAQNWQQMGASALLGSAIATPVAGRLQRLFGVSRLKIDPSFSGVENNPQARLTLEQQITRDITFTYITNLARSNYQVVRVEWSFSREWSVIALREENGLFGIDFLYKKRFK